MADTDNVINITAPNDSELRITQEISVRKQNVPWEAVKGGLTIGGGAIGVGSLANVLKQQWKGGVLEEAGKVGKFSYGSHNNWTNAALAAGFVTGATVSTIGAIHHNRDVKEVKSRAEKYLAEKVNAADVGQSK